MDRSASLQVLKQFTSDTGLPITLPAHATVLNVNTSDWLAGTSERFSVTLDVYEVAETVRELRFVKHGTRMMIWTEIYDFTDHTNAPDVYARDGSMRAYKCTSMTLWDDDFVPFTEHRVGRIETPAEYAARRKWEGEQYRVGSDKSPMDSAYRVTLGDSPMADYWMKG
jgi:hypothetical protein